MIKLNQITSNFNFVTAVVHKIDINCQMLSISEENKREFGLDIKCSKPYTNGDKKFGKLLLKIKVNVEQKDSSIADTFLLIMEGVFSSSTDLSDDEFIQLLNINGGTVLYSMARAKIETLSGLTYANGKILLPMVNIIQYFQERHLSEDDSATNNRNESSS